MEKEIVVKENILFRKVGNIHLQITTKVIIVNVTCSSNMLVSNICVNEHVIEVVCVIYSEEEEKVY